MHSLIQDIGFSLRLMRKRPGTTFLVITSLMLGIGLNSAIFSVVNAVLLRPLPIFNPDRVVWLRSKVIQTSTPLGTSYPDFLDWKSQNRSFEAMAAMRALSFTMTGYGSPEHLKSTAISASGFKTWGVSTILGRDFADGDDQPGANRVTILSYAFWQRKFGGDLGVLGKTLTLDDQSYIIIGVLRSIQLDVLRYPDVYIANGPLVDQHVMERDTRYFFPIARLKPNVSLAQARTDMETIAGRLASQYPGTNKNMGIRLDGFSEQLTADGRKPLALLMVASSLIFLLALVNVMTVFLAATLDRAPELIARLALGAARSSLVRQLFIQALIVAVIGGILGLLLAKLGLALFLHRFPTAVLRFQETTIDIRVVFATIGMTLLASLIAALPSAVSAITLGVGRQITNGGNSFTLSKSRVFGRAALILFEISLASALSLVSGLLIKSFYEIAKIDLGFNPHRVLSFQINMPVARYKEPAKQSAFYRLAAAKLASLPGLESTSAISGLPLTTQGEVNILDVDAQSPLAGERLLVEDESVLPGFFRTMRLPLLQGRDFTDADHEGTAPVAIVDDVLAAKLWPAQNPLGKRIRMTGLRNNNPHWIEVVGVVRQIKHFGSLAAKVRWMQVYVPQYQDPTPMLSFVSNTTAPESATLAAVEKAIHKLDKDIPVENFQSMDDLLDASVSGRNAGLLLLTSFAAIGLVLGMVGIFGVVSNSVVRRRREIAIRMALGATRQGTTILISRFALLASLGGVLVGSGVVITFARVLSSFLIGITALHAPVYLASTAIIVTLTLVASFLPAASVSVTMIEEILRE